MRRKLAPRRLLCTFLAVVFCLAGCVSTPEPAPRDAIRPYAVTEEQRDLLELIQTPNQEIYVFQYSTQAAFSHIDVWVEVYRDGELVEPHLAGVSQSAGEARPLSGEIAVLITPDPWTFSFSHRMGDGGLASYAATSETEFSTGTRAQGEIREPVAIRPGEEIVLYSALFTNKNTLATHDEQEYAARPELLREVEYAHLIKCKFE